MNAHGTLTLLAIDDDLQNLELIRAALEQPGLQILTADDPEEGFKIFLQARPNIVLLDLVMPGANGMELLERTAVRLKFREAILTH